MECYIHPKLSASLTCSRCGEWICGDCVGDDSIGIKCLHCIVLQKNPLYVVTVPSLLFAVGASLGSLPIIMVAWVLGIGYLPIVLPGVWIYMLVPAILGWLLSVLLSKMLKSKRSKMIFVTGSLAIVGSYVGVLLLGWSLMNLWDFIGIGIAIYFMRHKLL